MVDMVEHVSVSPRDRAYISSLMQIFLPKSICDLMIIPYYLPIINRKEICILKDRDIIMEKKETAATYVLTRYGINISTKQNKSHFIPCVMSQHTTITVINPTTVLINPFYNLIMIKIDGDKITEEKIEIMAKSICHDKKNKLIYLLYSVNQIYVFSEDLKVAHKVFDLNLLAKCIEIDSDYIYVIDSTSYTHDFVHKICKMTGKHMAEYSQLPLLVRDAVMYKEKLILLSFDGCLMYENYDGGYSKIDTFRFSTNKLYVYHGALCLTNINSVIKYS